MIIENEFCYRKFYYAHHADVHNCLRNTNAYLSATLAVACTYAYFAETCVICFESEIPAGLFVVLVFQLYEILLSTEFSNCAAASNHTCARHIFSVHCVSRAY